MIRSHVLWMAPVLFLMACETDPAANLRPSYMLATVNGALEKDYEGTGEFHTGTPGAGMKQFQITSDGNGASANQSFALTRWDGGRLGRGTYPLALVSPVDYRAQPRGMTAQFFTIEDGYEEQFVADSGEIEITSSSESLVEGRFRFTGFRYCARERIRSNPPVPPVGPCTPLLSSPLTDAPKITVSGSFVATPLEVGGTVMELWR